MDGGLRHESGLHGAGESEHWESCASAEAWNVEFKQPVTAYCARACFEEKAYADPPAWLRVSALGRAGPTREENKDLLAMIVFGLVLEFS
jgi:hypothetical protein